MPELTGVAHVSLTVRNLGASDQWYRELFGFERIHEERQAHFDSVVLFEPVSGLLLSLRRHHGAGTARFDETRTGLDHVSFGVSDRAELESWEQRLTERHVEHSPIADTPFGAVLVLRDPDHIQLELSWRSREPTVPPADAPDPVGDTVTNPVADA
ncbi:MAG: VOC family protein [Acidimicrobiales bacterium]